MVVEPCDEFGRINGFAGREFTDQRVSSGECRDGLHERRDGCDDDACGVSRVDVACDHESLCEEVCGDAGLSGGEFECWEEGGCIRVDGADFCVEVFRFVEVCADDDHRPFGAFVEREGDETDGTSA